MLLGRRPAFGVGIAALVAVHARNFAIATVPILAVTAHTIIFERAFRGGAMLAGSRPGIGMGIGGMAFRTGHAAESAQQIRAVALRGTGGLAIFQDVVTVCCLGNAGSDVWKSGVTTATAGSAAADSVCFLMAAEAGRGIQAEDVFDVNTVLSGILPPGFVGEDAGGHSGGWRRCSGRRCCGGLGRKTRGQRDDEYKGCE